MKYEKAKVEVVAFAATDFYMFSGEYTTFPGLTLKCYDVGTPYQDQNGKWVFTCHKVTFNNNGDPYDAYNATGIVCEPYTP